MSTPVTARGEPGLDDVNPLPKSRPMCASSAGGPTRKPSRRQASPPWRSGRGPRDPCHRLRCASPGGLDQPVAIVVTTDEPVEVGLRWLPFERPEPAGCASPEWWRLLSGRASSGGWFGQVLVVDWAQHMGGAVPSAVVVEVVAPGQHDGPGMIRIEQLVAGQDLPFQAGEERLRGGVVEAGPDPAHGLTNTQAAAEQSAPRESGELRLRWLGCAGALAGSAGSVGCGVGRGSSAGGGQRVPVVGRAPSAAVSVGDVRRLVSLGTGPAFGPARM